MISTKRLRARREGGFTLIEVLVAVLIVAGVCLILLQRRIEVVRDAARIRDLRVAWTLVALKMGELSQDPGAIQASDAGDFSTDLPDQAAFRWSYESQRESIPLDEEPGQPPREILRVSLKVFDPEENELQSLEAMFPAPAPEPPPAEEPPPGGSP